MLKKSILRRSIEAALIASPLMLPISVAAEDSYIQLGFGNNVSLSSYNARSGNTYYATGSIDGTAVQDADGNTWNGSGAVAIAFQPTSDTAATAIESVVTSVGITYGTTPTIAITLAAGIDATSVVNKIAVSSSGLSANFAVTKGNLRSLATISGQTITMSLSATISSGAPVEFVLSFEDFTTPAGLNVGTIAIVAEVNGLTTTQQSANPELTSLTITPTSGSFESSSFIRANFDEAVRLNQTPSEADSLNKINTVLVKADTANNNATQRAASISNMMDSINGFADKKLTLSDVTGSITGEDISVELNGNSSYISITDGGAFAVVSGGNPAPTTPTTDANTSISDAVSNIDISNLDDADALSAAVDALTDAASTTTSALSDVASQLASGDADAAAAVSAVSATEDVMSTLATVAASGGDVDADATSNVLASVGDTINAVVNQTGDNAATTEQLTAVIDTVDTVLDSMDEVMATADASESATLISSMSDTLGAGVAAVLANSDSADQASKMAGLIDNIGDSMTAALSGQTDVSDTAAVLDNAKDLISSVLTAAAATDDATMALAAAEAMEAEVSSIVDSLASTLDATDVDDASSTAAQNMMSDVGEIFTAIVSGGAVLDASTVTEAKNLANKASEKALDALAASQGVTVTDASDTEAVKALLSDNVALLQAVIDSVAVDLTAGTQIGDTEKLAAVDAVLADVSAEDRVSIAAALPKNVDPKKAVVADESGAELTVEAVLSSSVSEGFSSGTVTADESTGVVSVVIGETTFPVNVAEVKLVPDSVPEGIRALPDGSILSVSNGIATTVVPAPADPVAFSSALVDTGLSDVAIESNGKVSLSTADGNSFAGRFDFGITESDGQGSTGGSVEFEAPTGEPSDPAYVYTVNYPDGSSQKILPLVADTTVFDSLGGLGLGVSTDTSTGVMSVGNASFKPAYFVLPMSTDAQSYLDSNRDASGVAYRPTDANGDGVTDYEIISNSGVQVVYGVE